MKSAALGCALAVLALCPPVSRAQTPAEDYAQNCAMCHTIGGGPLAGPDLAEAADRRERSWLIRFIVDPQAVIDSGDQAAHDMVERYQGMVMPAIPGMTPERAAALMDYVAQQSESPKQEGGEAPDEKQEPFSAADVEAGLYLFRGDQPLEADGTACFACHDLAGVGGLGGGGLGPPLNDIYERMGGRKGLTSWLSAPPTPTMSFLYRTRPLDEQEIRSLTALLEDRSVSGAAGGSGGPVVFLLGGAAGTVLLLFAFHLIWRRRLHGVRRHLVESYRLRGVQ